MGNEKLTELRNAMFKANAESKEADDKAKAAASAYGAAIAEEMGVHVGSIITVTRRVGYGPSAKERITRYRVHRIGFKNYGTIPLAIKAVRLRKDGSDGEMCDVWETWKLEPIPAVVPEPQEA